MVGESAFPFLREWPVIISRVVGGGWCVVGSKNPEEIRKDLANPQNSKGNSKFLLETNSGEWVIKPTLQTLYFILWLFWLEGSIFTGDLDLVNYVREPTMDLTILYSVFLIFISYYNLSITYV